MRQPRRTIDVQPSERVVCIPGESVELSLPLSVEPLSAIIDLFPSHLYLGLSGIAKDLG